MRSGARPPRTIRSTVASPSRRSGPRIVNHRLAPGRPPAASPGPTAPAPVEISARRSGAPGGRPCVARPADASRGIDDPAGACRRAGQSSSSTSIGAGATAASSTRGATASGRTGDRGARTPCARDCSTAISAPACTASDTARADPARTPVRRSTRTTGCLARTVVPTSRKSPGARRCQPWHPPARFAGGTPSQPRQRHRRTTYAVRVTSWVLVPLLTGSPR